MLAALKSDTADYPDQLRITIKLHTDAVGAEITRLNEGLLSPVSTAFFFGTVMIALLFSVLLTYHIIHQTVTREVTRERIG